ncbi:MAG: hypothetical protein M1607_00515 [Patescibacteria group bacterium]|nr:hypothetical protein [Patescibacteria group bacterium]
MSLFYQRTKLISGLLLVSYYVLVYILIVQISILKIRYARKEGIMAYQYQNKKGTMYYLHATDVVLKGSNLQKVIYYFAKEPGAKAINDLPNGYEVVENKRTGLPTLRKIR